MNHIEFYESVINDNDTSVDMRVYVRSFYQLPLKEALDIIENITILLDMKLNDYMLSK